MKNYLKIMLITLTIQLAAFELDFVLYNYSNSTALKDFGTVIVICSVIIAIIVDVILAIKWGTNILQKIVYILFMPTNYLWLIFFLFVFWCIGQWIDILTHVYD